MYTLIPPEVGRPKMGASMGSASRSASRRHSASSSFWKPPAVLAMWPRPSSSELARWRLPVSFSLLCAHIPFSVPLLPSSCGDPVVTLCRLRQPFIFSAKSGPPCGTAHPWLSAVRMWTSLAVIMQPARHPSNCFPVGKPINEGTFC